MAQTKTYVIEIQLDDARQQLADTNKKLAELDAKLEGMDRNSDAAKAIVSELAKLAKQAEGAESSIEQLNGRLDGLKPGSVGALRQQVEELEKAFEQTVIGTKEQQEALLALGNAKGELKALEDAVDALDPKMKAAAFVDFANGVVGAFGIAATAAQTFGLSSETAEEYQTKLLGLITVLSSVEQVSKALNSETLSVVKSALASGKAWLTAGESASAGAKVTRAALISTGIGAVVVLVGLLIANWDRLTASVKGSEAFFTKVKAVTNGLFDAFIAQVKLAGTLLGDVFTGNIGQLVIDAKEGGKKVGEAYSKGYQESIAESNRKVLEGQIAAQARLIEVLKARGVETNQLEEANLLAKLKIQKQGTEEEKQQYLDLQKDLDVLRATQAQKAKADAEALTQARMSGVLAIEQAGGRDSFAAQLKLEQEKLAALKAATTPQLAAIESQQNAITALILAKEKERADKRRTYQAATLQAELARRTAQGGDEYQLALDQNALQEKIAQQHLDTLRAAAQRDRGAEAQAEADLFRLKVERADIYYKERQRQEEEHQKSIESEVNGDYVRGLIREKKYQADLAIVRAGAAKHLEDLAAESAERARLRALAPLTLGDTILIRLFGLTNQQVDAAKSAINKAATELAQDFNAVISTMLSEGMTAADAQLQQAQARLSELDKQLSETSSRRQADEAALAGATGARRDYLLTKINSERNAEARLAAEKAKAAKEEQQAAKEKARLDKEQQQITAATTAVEAVLLGIKAAETLVSIASKGKFGFDNIALALAATATLGTGIFALRNAAKVLGDGGIIEGGSHASGNDVPVFGGRVRVEGGEAITPVDATQKNGPALELIRKAGRTRTLTLQDFAAAGAVRAMPPAGRTMGDGGILPGGSSVGGFVNVPASDLAALLDTNRQMVQHLQAVALATASTANHTGQIRDYGPAQLTFGHEAEVKRRQVADEVDATLASIKL